MKKIPAAPRRDLNITLVSNSNAHFNNRRGVRKVGSRTNVPFKNATGALNQMQLKPGVGMYGEFRERVYARSRLLCSLRLGGADRLDHAVAITPLQLAARQSGSLPPT